MENIEFDKVVSKFLDVVNIGIKKVILENKKLKN